MKSEAVKARLLEINNQSFKLQLLKSGVIVQMSRAYIFQLLAKGAICLSIGGSMVL